MIGNKINAIVFIKEIMKIVIDIWLGFALIIEDIARAAEAPQIAVPEEIK